MTGLKQICKTSSWVQSPYPAATDKQISEDKVITISKLPWKTYPDKLSINKHYSAHPSGCFYWHLLLPGHVSYLALSRVLGHLYTGDAWEVSCAGPSSPLWGSCTLTPSTCGAGNTCSFISHSYSYCGHYGTHHSNTTPGNALEKYKTPGPTANLSL